jgi:uncharacterized protein (DUF433 family)
MTAQRSLRCTAVDRPCPPDTACAHHYKIGGGPCIRGLRIPVGTVVGMVTEGMSVDEILADYPDLEADDVREAVGFVQHRT